MKNNKADIQLSDLANVGSETLRDLQLLEITTVQQLAAKEPDTLYHELEERTGKHHDPCVWDIFAAIIHEARTGEGKPWWEWTPIRKEKFHHTPLCTHKIITSR